MGGMSKYILSITAVCICCGIIRALTEGKTGMSGIVKSLCGIVLAITVISPVVKIKIMDLSSFGTKVQLDADAFVQYGVEQSTEELRTIITQKTTAYIWEKASLYDCNIHELEVNLSSDSIPTPCAVKISGTFSPNARKQLTGDIESNLRIPKEKQQWIYQN